MSNHMYEWRHTSSASAGQFRRSEGGSGFKMYCSLFKNISKISKQLKKTVLIFGESAECCWSFCCWPVWSKCLQGKVHVHCATIATIVRVLNYLYAFLPPSFATVWFGTWNIIEKNIQLIWLKRLSPQLFKTPTKWDQKTSEELNGSYCTHGLENLSYFCICTVWLSPAHLLWLFVEHRLIWMVLELFIELLF